MLMQTAASEVSIALSPLPQEEEMISRSTAAGRRRGGTEVLDLQIGQLLCSRLCHDLIGPAAAINAGEELIREGDAADGDEAHELIADSARQLAGRLTFFRVAFGQSGSGSAGLSYGEAQRLAEGFLFGGRVRLEWLPNEGDLFGDAVLPGDSVRLLLCLIMLAADALPRGGRVAVGVETQAARLCFTLRAEGHAARLSEDVMAALRATEPVTVTARTVHAFYLSRLAERLHAEVDIQGEDAGRAMCFRASITAERTERRRA